MICLICQQRDADPVYGQCCPLCPSRLARRLAEIPALCEELHGLGFVQRDRRGDHGYPALDANGRRLDHFDQIANTMPAGPINGARNGPRVGGSTERPVPIRIDPTDLLAPARAGSAAVRMRGDWWLNPGGDPDQVGHLSVATELQTWVRDWASERREREPDPQVPVLCRWLADRLDWAVHHHPAVDEFERDVHRIHSALRAVVGDFPAPAKAMEAACPACDCLSLFQRYAEDWIECGECGRILRPEEYADYVRGLIAGARENVA